MYTLSIILNFHREGKIAENTIKNLRYAIFCAQNQEKSWSKIEVIVVLDNPDKITRNIVENNLDLFSKIEIVNYCDPGLSRNHGIKKANNNFTLLADGDDYISHGALSTLYQSFFDHYSQFKLSSEKDMENLAHTSHIAVFPELLVIFPILSFKHYVDSNENIRINMSYSHCYICKICCLRKILLENSFRQNQPPYGFEDWDLNNRLIALGVNFIVAKGYVLYYRGYDSKSVLQTHLKNKCIVRNSDIYSYKPKIDIFNAHSTGGANTSNTSVVPISQIEFIQQHKNFLLNYHEKNLSGGEGQIDSYQLHAGQVTIQVKIYQKLLSFLEDKQIIYFQSSAQQKFVDKHPRYYTNTVETKYACIIADKTDTPRSGIKLSRLSLLNECLDWESFSEIEQMHILIKAIINSNIKLIYIKNSNIGLKLIKYYHLIFKEYNIKVNLSLFCPEYEWNLN